MIRSIALQNFQSHESSLLEFDPGINILSGDSDSGKTAILRALNWVLTNRPAGEAFRRTGSESTIVTVDTDGGAISRVRSDRENLYVGVNAERLAAMGASVPELVLELLRMSPDISIQRQLDAPFLLSCSAGEVAQRLNAVVGLDDIDVGLSGAARRVKQNQVAYEAFVKQYGELFEQVESYAYLGQMEEEVGWLEGQFGKLLGILADADSLGALIVALRNDQAQLHQLPDIARALVRIQDCDADLQVSERVGGQVEILSTCLSTITQVLDLLRKLPDVLVVMGEIEEADQLLGQLREMADLGRRGVEVLKEEQRTRRDLRKVSKELAEQEAQFKRACPTICPLCGRTGEIPR